MSMGNLRRVPRGQNRLSRRLQPAMLAGMAPKHPLTARFTAVWTALQNLPISFSSRSVTLTKSVKA